MLQLSNFKLKQIDFVSIGIFAIAASFLFLYRVGIVTLLGKNTQLIAILIIGIALDVCGVSSLISVRQKDNTIHNSMFMISFFFSGILLTVGGIFLLIFQK